MYNELPRKILTFNYRGVWTINKAAIIIMWVNMEQHIPKPIQQTKSIIERMHPWHSTIRKNNYT